MEQDIAAQVVGLGGATDFSLWKLFLRADFVVKFVIILLIASSIFSWALIFDKFKLFKNINKSIIDFEKKFWKAKSAESFNNSLPANSKDPAVLIFKSAMGELLKTKDRSSAVHAARVGRMLEIATMMEMKKVEKEFYFFSTVGSTAPL
jgi:biopolymer transport protein TolQ